MVSGEKVIMSSDQLEIPDGPGIFNIQYLGCLSNRADGNRIASVMLDQGWVWGPSDVADLVIVMTCGYSLCAQAKSVAIVKQLSYDLKKDGHLWIGGCLPSINASLFENVDADKYFSPKEVRKLTNPSCHFKPLPSSISGLPNGAYLLRTSTGCNNNCSYCVIPRATGKFRQRSIDDIINEAVSATRAGSRFLYLVGEDIGAYGQNNGTTILDLVKELESACSEGTRFLLGSIHPRWFIQDVELFIRLFQRESIVPRVSIPVQSGSDRILRLMKRYYTVFEVETAIRQFLEACPGCELATDIIVGFPGESIEDFNQSLEFMLRWPFSSLDAFIFDNHPGTEASQLPDHLDLQEKQRRHQILCIEFARKYLNQKGIDNEVDLQKFLGDLSTFIPLNTNLCSS